MTKPKKQLRKAMAEVSYDQLKNVLRRNRSNRSEKGSEIGMGQDIYVGDIVTFENLGVNIKGMVTDIEYDTDYAEGSLIEITTKIGGVYRKEPADVTVIKSMAYIPPEIRKNLTEQVNHPNHYNHGQIEIIDVIETVLVGYKNSLISFDLGSVIKYIARAPFKGKLLEDLKKARWYLDHAIKTLEQREKVKSMGDKADEAAKKV